MNKKKAQTYTSSCNQKFYSLKRKKKRKKETNQQRNKKKAIGSDLSWAGSTIKKHNAKTQQFVFNFKCITCNVIQNTFFYGTRERA